MLGLQAPVILTGRKQGYCKQNTVKFTVLYFYKKELYFYPQEDTCL